MQPWEEHLARWESAGIVDGETTARIRMFEAAEERPASYRWQVLVVLIFGGVLLGAGVLLLVAAHWDQVSPLVRFGLVLAILAALHLGGVMAAERFPGMATALHAVGTIGAGAAIATVGQVFNMQEHWPAAVLLWAACAAAGYGWLRDQFQQVCLMLLLPAWLVCEWNYRASHYLGSDVYLARMTAVIAAVYLIAFLRSKQRIVAGILFAVAAVALVFTTAWLSEGWHDWSGFNAGLLPFSLQASAVCVMLLMIVTGWFWDKHSLPPVLLITAMAVVLPWLQAVVHERFPGQREYAYNTPSILLYALVAAVAAFLAWWGVGERSRALVNFGIAAFALTVAWFYFSSLMDKLGRSLGLIGLGTLFLLGGYLLERVRRSLIAEMRPEAVV